MLREFCRCEYMTSHIHFTVEYRHYFMPLVWPAAFPQFFQLSLFQKLNGSPCCTPESGVWCGTVCSSGTHISPLFPNMLDPKKRKNEIHFCVLLLKLVRNVFPSWQHKLSFLVQTTEKRESLDIHLWKNYNLKKCLFLNISSLFQKTLFSCSSPALTVVTTVGLPDLTCPVLSRPVLSSSVRTNIQTVDTHRLLPLVFR